MKLRVNDPCWCGSGKKYKKCHLRRHEEHRPNLGQVQAAMRKPFRRKLCLHPQAPQNCSRKIIDAHTISRSRVLGRFKDENGRVGQIAWNDDRSNLRPLSVQSIGWKKASTFHGFCSRHDQIFEPIDNREFTATDEQCFLFGYRAWAYELYKKTAYVEALKLGRQYFDRGRPQQEHAIIQEDLSDAIEQARRGLEDLSFYVELYGSNLSHYDFSSFNRCAIFFAGDLVLGATGAFQAELDANGNLLQDLSSSSRAQGVACGAMPTTEGGAIVCSWPKTDTKSGELARSLATVNEDLLPDYVVQFLFRHMENVYFSLSWWNNLQPGQRVLLRDYAETSGPFDAPIYLKRVNLTNWRITGIVPV